MPIPSSVQVLSRYFRISESTIFEESKFIAESSNESNCRARRFQKKWNREPNRNRKISVSDTRNRNRNREIKEDGTGTGTVGTENF